MKEVSVLGMLCTKHILKKNLFCVFFSTILLQSCVVLDKKQQQNHKNKIDILLKKYVNKKTNLLCKDLGEPMEKKVKVDSENKVIGIEFVYKFIYNFKQKKYDCHISFFTDKNLQKIKTFSKSSEKCNYITFKI